MPQTEVVFFKEEDGSAPALVWMDGIPPKAQDKCVVKVERLGEMGHELRRPEADFLRDAIYELRVGLQGINYRLLYFFHKKIAVISHGLTKEKQVPPKEIDLALARKLKFEQNPEKHTFIEEE
ncbi:MAG: type II toxin-antitoxin system RelE/ParE family toxin [Parachlamydiaceae bacterium]